LVTAPVVVPTVKTVWTPATLATVILPAPLVTVIFAPAVIVPSEKPAPELPIKNCPLVGALVVTILLLAPVTRMRLVLTVAGIVVLDQAGATPAPADLRNVPAALDGSFAKVVVVSAYRMSPTVYVVVPVPPLVAASVPPRVMVPEPVTGPPLVVIPVVPPDTFTLVTPPMGVLEVVMFPLPSTIMF
jgi:hypothetical protein